MEEKKQEEKVVNQVFTKEDIEKNKTMAIVGYFLFFVPYLAAKESKFAMFHAKQGLVLFLVALASRILIWILYVIFVPRSIYSIMAGRGTMAYLVWYLSIGLGIAILVLAIIGAISANNGESKELPIIGKYAKKF